MEELIRHYWNKFSHTSISDLSMEDIESLRTSFGEDWKSFALIYLEMRDD